LRFLGSIKIEFLRQIRANCLYGGTNFLPSYNVLAEVQGITLSPQQMPHASTYIRITTLGFWGEMPRLSDVWRSRSRWLISNVDGVIGLKLKGYSDSTVKLCCAYLVWICEVRRSHDSFTGELATRLLNRKK